MICVICGGPIFRCVNSAPPPDNCEDQYHHERKGKYDHSAIPRRTRRKRKRTSKWRWPWQMDWHASDGAL